MSAPPADQWFATLFVTHVIATLIAFNNCRVVPQFPLRSSSPGFSTRSSVVSSRLSRNHYGLPPTPLFSSTQNHKRQLNLSLLQTYGPNAWRVHNYLTEAAVVQYEKALERLQDQVTEVNRSRKNSQVRQSAGLSSYGPVACIYSLSFFYRRPLDSSWEPAVVVGKSVERAHFRGSATGACQRRHGGGDRRLAPERR